MNKTEALIRIPLTSLLHMPYQGAADVWLTVPAAWDAMGCQMMRDAAITAGLVQSSRAGDRDWRDRLRIITYVLIPFALSTLLMIDIYASLITCAVTFVHGSSHSSEPEAAAVHCAHLTDLHKLQPNQNFMICDAGGGTVVCDLPMFRRLFSLIVTNDRAFVVSILDHLIAWGA